MADKPGPKPDVVEEVITIVFILMVLGAFASRLVTFVSSTPFYTTPFYSFWLWILENIAPGFRFVGTIVSITAFIGTIYSFVQLRKINEEENEVYRKPTLPDVPMEGEIAKNRKWERVLAHLASTNASEWRLAIIEADIMLGELLEAAKYPGATIADKLKTVERADFHTIEAAWEAHKVRNAIAHEGADYILTREEAERTIALFRIVFEEFHYI